MGSGRVQGADFGFDDPEEMPETYCKAKGHGIPPMKGGIDVDIVWPQDAIRKESSQGLEDEHQNGQKRERPASASLLARRSSGDSRVSV
jgi:hypothetical protein